jgi:hypothetical protein
VNKDEWGILGKAPDPWEKEIRATLHEFGVLRKAFETIGSEMREFRQTLKSPYTE